MNSFGARFRKLMFGSLIHGLRSIKLIALLARLRCDDEASLRATRCPLYPSGAKYS